MLNKSQVGYLDASVNENRLRLSSATSIYLMLEQGVRDMNLRRLFVILIVYMTPSVALGGICVDASTGVAGFCYIPPPPPPPVNHFREHEQQLEKQVQITQHNNEILRQQLQQEQLRQQEAQQAQMDRQRALEEARMAPILAAQQAQINLENQQRQARFDSEHTNCKQSYPVLLRSMHLKQTSIRGICTSGKSQYQQCPPCN